MKRRARPTKLTDAIVIAAQDGKRRGESRERLAKRLGVSTGTISTAWGMARPLVFAKPEQMKAPPAKSAPLARPAPVAPVAAGLTGDPALAVRVAVDRVSAADPRLADALAQHPVHEVIAGMHGDSPHATAIEAMGSPAGLAWIALGATVDEFTGREDGQSEASYAAFLRTVRPAHIARAKALLRATVDALATVYTESFDDYPGASATPSKRTGAP